MDGGGRAHRAACRDDMTGEAEWVGFLVVGLELGRMCCARAGSSRALVLPCEALVTDGACGGRPAGYVGQTTSTGRVPI